MYVVWDVEHGENEPIAAYALHPNSVLNRLALLLSRRAFQEALLS